MEVFPELSKNTWLILLSLATQPQTATQLAKANNIRLNRVSEALDQLEDFGIVKGRVRKQLLSIEASLSTILRELLIYYSKERLAEALEGKKLNTLFQILVGYDTIEKLNLIVSYSVPTIKRIVSAFQERLLVYQPKRGIYRIRDEFLPKIKMLHSSFFAYFADRLKSQDINWKEIKVFGNTVLLKSNHPSLPSFVYTAFSLFHKYKVPLIMTDDNYFVNYKKEPCKEEVFIHALTFSINDYRYMLYCTLFADLNKLTLKKLKKLPLIFKLENEVAAIFDFLISKGQRRAIDYLPTYEEYLSARENFRREFNEALKDGNL